MVTTSALRQELAAAPKPDDESANLTQTRIDNILRPPGALARLDELAIWLARWQNTATPCVDNIELIVFAGDHGVTAEGVSNYPADVTAAMLDAFRADKASVNALARVVGATSRVVDVGVGEPTGNIRVEPAMTSDRLDTSFAAGRAAVAASDADLLVFGELGIGNTTAAAALAAAYLTVDATKVTGKGTGIDAHGLLVKQQVVSDAANRIGVQGDPVEVLRELGGTEIAAIAGAIFQARVQSTPVLLDGFIVGSAALTAHAIGSEATAHCWAGHGSAELGHQLVLDYLGLTPLLTLDLRLGEGSGAIAAVPLVRAACALVNEVPTFEEWFGPAPE